MPYVNKFETLKPKPYTLQIKLTLAPLGFSRVPMSALSSPSFGPRFPVRVVVQGVRVYIAFMYVYIHIRICTYHIYIHIYVSFCS